MWLVLVILLLLLLTGGWSGYGFTRGAAYVPFTGLLGLVLFIVLIVLLVRGVEP
jgi:hypothetical protein